jgi:hypothetical protein
MRVNYFVQDWINSEEVKFAPLSEEVKFAPFPAIFSSFQNADLWFHP